MASIEDTLESFISAEDDNAGIPYSEEEIGTSELVVEDENGDGESVEAAPSDYPPWKAPF